MILEHMVTCGISIPTKRYIPCSQTEQDGKSSCSCQCSAEDIVLSKQLEGKGRNVPMWWLWPRLQQHSSSMPTSTPPLSPGHLRCHRCRRSCCPASASLPHHHHVPCSSLHFLLLLLSFPGSGYSFLGCMTFHRNAGEPVW